MSAHPPQTPAVDTATVRAVRAQIEPRTGWWQAELRPWHYWTAIGSAAVTGAGFLILCAALAWGAHR